MFPWLFGVDRAFDLDSHSKVKLIFLSRPYFLSRKKWHHEILGSILTMALTMTLKVIPGQGHFLKWDKLFL